MTIEGSLESYFKFKQGNRIFGTTLDRRGEVMQVSVLGVYVVRRRVKDPGA